MDISELRKQQQNKRIDWASALLDANQGQDIRTACAADQRAIIAAVRNSQTTPPTPPAAKHK